jgi:hypothetical protein
MTEIRACCPTPEASPHVPSCPEHVPPQGRQRPSKVTMVVRDTETGEDIELSGTRDVPIPEFLGSPVDWDADDPGGVWVTYYLDQGPVVNAVHPDEITALRAAVAGNLSERVVFWRYGTDLADAITAAEKPPG